MGSLKAYEKKRRKCDEDIVENAFKTKINIRSQKLKNDRRNFNLTSCRGETSKSKEKGKEK